VKDSRKVVLIAESSMKSKIRIDDYNNFRMYNVGRVVFDTSLLVGRFTHSIAAEHFNLQPDSARQLLRHHCDSC
jgi:hypothetical protein